MADSGQGGQVKELDFRTATGERVREAATPAGPWEPVNGLLRRRLVDVVGPAGSRRLALVVPVEKLQGAAQQRAYELLDNETLAGIRLARLAERSGLEYPAQLSRLVGYEAFSRSQFVLLEPPDGVPVQEVAGKLLVEDRTRFMVELFTALRWISAAGLAHRGLTPTSVLWSPSGHVQVTDFCLATLIGVPRSVAGRPPWAAPEQRADPAVGPISGTVGDRDDLWSAAKLIGYVVTGAEIRREQLVQADLGELLEDALQPPEQRPPVVELLRRLKVADPLQRVRDRNLALEEGRKVYDSIHSPGHWPPGGRAQPTQPVPVPVSGPVIDIREKGGPAQPPQPARKGRWRRD